LRDITIKYVGRGDHDSALVGVLAPESAGEMPAGRARKFKVASIQHQNKTGRLKSSVSDGQHRDQHESPVNIRVIKQISPR
jgi:hypothetical protein